MHPDILTVLVAFGGFLMLVVFGIGLHQWSKKQQAKQAAAESEERAKRELRAKAEVKKLVSEGTHLETGEFRCRIGTCQSPARHPRIRLPRDEHSPRAYVRRLFGAPPRYRVAADLNEPAYCGPHAPLVAQAAAHRLAVHEMRRAEFLLEEEAEISHFEAEGLDALAAEHAAKASERASNPPAKLASVSRAGGVR